MYENQPQSARGFTLAKAKSTNLTSGRQVVRLKLATLLLDPHNPRFGMQDHSANQTELLDHIVDKFGVNDVLSSLAVNGYFEAEPLVCKKTSGDKVTVAEGNRRLAACLILAGDPRASNQSTRAIEFQKIWTERGKPTIDPVPVILFEEKSNDKELLSYLGVRHIASSQPWDSFAKAAWVAQVVKTSGLTIAEVSQMIGDRHRTVNRLLEGYFVVEQLVDAGEFVAENSVRSGRGSVTDYPFSWVYTTLGYKTVRDYLEMDDSEAKAKPLKEKAVTNGGILLRALFGDKSKGRNSAIEDSREISSLAKIFASKEHVRLLEEGKSLREITVLTMPLEQQLSEGLLSARDILRSLVASLAEQEIEKSLAEEFVSTSGSVKKLATELDKKLRETAYDTDE